jgi:hypothetical protein
VRCGGLINILSFSMITWRSVISIFLSCHINFFKHLHLRGSHGSISLMGITYVSPLQRSNSLHNYIFLLSLLGGALQKFSDYITMRELFYVVVFIRNHTWKLRIPSHLSISIMRTILLVRIFLRFMLFFLLTSWLLRGRGLDCIHLRGLSRR